VVYDYSLKEEGAVSLQRLLTVVECVRPEITHVPVRVTLALHSLSSNIVHPSFSSQRSPLSHPSHRLYVKSV
jgi:hypothetical protein